ncbi:VOC family protein [Halalkalibacter hemicellulosilyticus]|uniref:VOC domain-containing protein n=1 Tax=Halalkalibacter hemicellulosilyticusJCM 9152 TaxID=1236971 RepID=W4QLF4_9BACI|nr:VOC family protein [Halalkalibacter hemicellulosilyticus]GAE32935.1 hypothetical protein JCM9152_4530 [Halalkalibacter hemicellulosilyticusJCM 9152]
MSKKMNDSPIQNKVGGIFVPVRNVEKARKWYCQMLGLPETDEIDFGHLYVLPMNGVDVILDEMPVWGGLEEGGAEAYKAPAFMFRTGDIYASYKYIKEMGAELVMEVENDQWFVFKDPDGNHIMVCQ